MKQLSSRFSMAVHTLSIISLNHGDDCTGDFIASSVNTNPVIIRRILGMLKKAGLVNVRPGVGGAFLLKDPADISLLDIYRAVDIVEDNQLFRFHDDPNQNCPIGRNIERVLQAEFIQAQTAMEQQLAQTSLHDLIAQF